MSHRPCGSFWGVGWDNRGRLRRVRMRRCFFRRLRGSWPLGRWLWFRIWTRLGHRDPWMCRRGWHIGSRPVWYTRILRGSDPLHFRKWIFCLPWRVRILPWSRWYRAIPVFLSRRVHCDSFYSPVPEHPGCVFFPSPPARWNRDSWRSYRPSRHWGCVSPWIRCHPPLHWNGQKNVP